MALDLKFGTIVQSNDAVILRIPDGTGDYDAIDNPGGWVKELDAPVAGQPKVSNLDGLTTFLYLDVVYTDSSNETTTYNTVDLYASFGPFTDRTDLVFDIDPSMLISTVNGQAQGTDEDRLLDGWYNITYTFTDTSLTYADSIVSTDIFVDGVIRTKVYTSLKNVIYANEFERFNIDFKEWKDILYPQYYYSMFVGMLAEVSIARKVEVLSILKSLETLLNQVSI